MRSLKRLNMKDKEFNKGENLASIINNNVYLREFTFSETRIKTEENLEIEIADNIVWIDDILLLIQVKTRGGRHSIEANSKWFRNKILKKAKNQIRDTLTIISEGSNITLENNRGVRIELRDLPIGKHKSIILYSLEGELDLELYGVKFIESSTAGLVHVFDIEIYGLLCSYLMTPIEINDYLGFREDVLENFRPDISIIPEKTILGLFFSGEDTNVITDKYDRFVDELDEDYNDYNLNDLLLPYFDRLILNKNDTDYLFIIKEIMKLNRFGRKEFKLRYERMIDYSK